ncbi:hypothetical protein GCM10020227_43530 [Streptomyces flavovirens]
MAQHRLVGVLALEPGRRGQQRGDGAEERGDDDERQKELHHGWADIDHGSRPGVDVGKDDGGDRQDEGSGEQRAEVGLHVAGLGAAHEQSEPAGGGAGAAYVGVDDLAVQEADEACGGLDRPDEERRVEGVQVEAGDRVAVEGAEQEAAGVRRVGRARDRAVGGGVRGDRLGFDEGGLGLGVGGDGSDRGGVRRVRWCAARPRR